jgi:hypothetical protein
MRKNAGLILFLLLVFVAGCAPGPTISWKSAPEIQTASNEYCKAQLEPVTTGKGAFFDAFRLMVTNRTDKDLEIDWNRTRYVESGIRHGGFVWQGIDPEQVRDASIPPDIISPGGYQRGWKLQGGLLPEGENGIDLVVRQNGRVIRHRITVRIVEEKQK